MKRTGSGLLVCAAFVAALGCSARAGGGWVPIVEEDSGTSSNNDVVIPGVDVVIPGVDVPGLMCAPPEFNCGGRCANLLTDSANCGGCGRACGAGAACSGGTCVTGPSCMAPSMLCNGTCVDVRVNPLNCGACGNACAAGQSCSNGVCTGGSTCAPPRTMCATCTDTRTDPQNCGVCNLACAAGQSCSNGVCVGGTTCVAPRMLCGGSCVDVLTSPAHCGFCGNACAAGQTCTNGSCTGGGTGCTAPNISCGGRCVNPQTDAQNCGSCLNACAAGQTCSAGRCVGGSTGSLAGRACLGPTDTTTCGGALECAPVGGQAMCTTSCTNNASQTSERAACGGTGSTCLLLDAMTGDGFCTTACTAGAGQCRAGFVCTTRSLNLQTPDSAGCFPFCSSNAQCYGGAVCNVRTGFCGPAAANPSRLADGSPCNPSMTETPPGETEPRNTQCRGVCFRLSATNSTQGICGSLINLTQGTTCPDPGVQPRGSMTDEIGLCLWRDCTRNADCGTTLRCVYPERAGVPDRTLTPICAYTTTAQPNGIP